MRGIGRWCGWRSGRERDWVLKVILLGDNVSDMY